MKKVLLRHCIEAGEARLYDFVKATNVVCTGEVPTAAVDNKGNLYINKSFYQENQQHIIGLLLHESLHVYFDHVNNDYEHKMVANIAFDVIINDIVMGIGYTLPEEGVTYENCKPPVPRIYKTSEEVYEYLLDNMDDIPDDLLNK
jgi:Predicted metallopeptidase (DUF2201).